MIRDTVRDLARGEFAKRAIEIDRTEEFPRENFERLKELGLMGVMVPESHGGAGADTLSWVLTLEEIAYACPSTALGLAAHHSLCTLPIWNFGTEEQRRRFVPPLARGEVMGSYGLTEPGAGSDSGGTRTTALVDGDHFRVSGAKTFITNGSHASTFVLAVKTDPAQTGSRGISALIVERSTPGFTIGKKESKLGMRGSDTVQLSLDGCRVPRANLLGELHDGFKIFMNTLDGGRIGIAALALGIAQAAFERACAYSKERHAFGKPIAAFQGVANLIADMAVDLDASRHLVYHSARLKDAAQPYTREAAVAKLFASEAAMRVTHDAIQVLGGYGYMQEYEVERMCRDAKLCTIGEGTSEIQRIVIARQVLGKVAGVERSSA
ncbi:MAG: acyl-CoA dehydrogenase family protein [Planctomycetes bacterium]|nr:acyl-CoA dehydrogenase family protein [Planctomycetota bacterium]